MDLTCAPLVEWSLVQRWYRVPRYRKGNTQRRDGELQPITAQHHHPANHSSPGRLQGGHEALLRHRQLAGQPGRCDIQEISLYPLQIKALLLLHHYF